MKKMLKEFKEFATRGSVFDLAVGIIIGGAFKSIVTSFVGDILMPIISLVFGNVNVSDLKIVLEEGTEEVPELAIRYGAFLQTTIDFIIIAFVIFLIIRWANKMKRKEEEAPEAPAEPPKNEVLLEEIRDLLKSK